VPVSVKLRRGYDDTELSRERFWRILDGCHAAGADAVTLHPRTVLQRYAGPSDWEFLAEAKRHVGTRVLLGSGDLFTAADCLRMIRRTRVDGVTAARGAIGNPWLFAECRALAAGKPWTPPTLAEQRAVIEEHYRLADETYGPRRAGPIMRKFGIKYARLHPKARQVRDAFVAVRQPEDWRAVLERWYPA
jgi:tRNA-dihydrouridine synthase